MPELDELLGAIKALETKVDGVSKQVTDINVVLTGSMASDKVGLLERVRRLEAWVEAEKRVAWVFGGAIAMDVIMRIWSLVAGK